jgi:uncharacterized C2H2 Zn-finger protein
LKNCENEIKSQHNLFEENKKLRKLLEIHQKAMTYKTTVNDHYMQCPHCPKAFFDSDFLKRHISKRHPNDSLDSEGIFPLKQKIEKYATLLNKDNKSVEQLKEKIQELSEKLGKTELDLLLEKEERIKSLEGIGYDLHLSVDQMIQNLREEIEDLKFTQRESLFKEDLDSSDQNMDEINRNAEQNSNFKNINKFEEMIAIQTKEMIKLGNNVQKMVSHLTQSLPKDTDIQQMNKSLTKINKKANEQKTTIKAKGIEKEIKNVENVNNIENNEQNKRQNSGIIASNRKISETESVKSEVKETLKQKLNSFAIDFDSSGISEEQYLKAMKKLKAERNLLIEQNRHDFDFVSIEKSIRKLIDQKVSELSFKKSEDSNSIKSEFQPKVKERKTLTLDLTTNKTQTLKTNETQSIAAIVHLEHNRPTTERSVTSDQKSKKTIDSETKPELNKSISVSQSVRPKSVLVSHSSKIGTNDENNSFEVKAKQQKRIRFSEHRIEHQISPEDSSEETSDENSSIDFDNSSSTGPDLKYMTSMAPIPAQRNHRNLSSHISNSKTEEQINDELIEDMSHEIDEHLMNEILNTNSYSINDESIERKTDRSVRNSNQTKVQEIAELIEEKLSKRSALNKKPPIGSVNVMSADKEKLSSKSLIDSLNSDLENY